MAQQIETASILPIRKLMIFGESYFFPLDTAFQGRIHLTQYEGHLEPDPRKPSAYAELTFYHVNFPEKTIRKRQKFQTLSRNTPPQSWNTLWSKERKTASFLHTPRHDIQKIENIQAWYWKRFKKYIPELEAALNTMFLVGQFDVSTLEKFLPTQIR